MVKGPVVAVHDYVDEAFVFDHLVVPKDPWVRKSGERRQLELGGVDAALVETVEQELLRGEAREVPERVDGAGGALAEHRVQLLV